MILMIESKLVDKKVGSFYWGVVVFNLGVLVYFLV